MNEKEIGEIRRRQRRDRSNITAIYGCYVNENKEIITEFRQSTGIMPENESDKYFALLRRVLSGSTVNIDDVLESNNAGDEWASPSEFVAYYIGDANGDHRVNIKDATHIQKALAGLVELDRVEMIAAEVDRTDMITIKDATTIQKWLARMDTGTYNDDFIGRFWVCQ